MKNKLSSILRKVFLSSLAGITANNTIDAQNIEIERNSNQDENKVVSPLEKKIDLTPKLRLKRTGLDEWSALAHRSHRSHSSHRSHYSSSSGGTYTPPSSSSSSSNETYTPPRSSGNTSNGTYKPPSGSGNSSSTTSNETIGKTTLRLGSRTLKKGMSGTDVTELINILLRRSYLTLDDGATTVTGSHTYDVMVESAVKKFQLDNGLTSDGICGSITIYYLKNKN